MSKRSFTKLFRSILDSTLWVQHPNHVKVVWIAMLAEADGDGFVANTIPGLARRAGVTIEECEEALAAFLAPDKYSRTKDHEGRRIEETMGGWILLNYEKRWRELDAEDERQRKREYMRIKRAAERRALESDSIPPFSPQSATCSDVPNVASISLSSSRSDLSDPDPEQPPCLPEVPGLLKPGPRERTGPTGAQPVLKYEFDPDFLPDADHRARAQELRLTDDEVFAKAEDCRNKTYTHPFKSDKKQFMRELGWLKVEKDKQAYERSKSVGRGRDFESPGHRRAAGTE